MAPNLSDWSWRFFGDNCGVQLERLVGLHRMCGSLETVGGPSEELYLFLPPNEKIPKAIEASWAKQLACLVMVPV